MAESYDELESVRLPGGEEGAVSQEEIVTMTCMHVSIIIAICMYIIYCRHVLKYHSIYIMCSLINFDQFHSDGEISTCG